MKRYYEAHLTVTPPPGPAPSYEQFTEWMSKLGWKTSRFDHDDVDGIEGMWFCSDRSNTDDEILAEVRKAYLFLAEVGLEVSRWKIEWTLYDSKLGHRLDLAQ